METKWKSGDFSHVQKQVVYTSTTQMTIAGMNTKYFPCEKQLFAFSFPMQNDH